MYLWRVKIENRSYLLMHIAVLLWSFTAILGKAISLTEFVLVWYRMIITAVLLLIIPGVWKGLKSFGLKALSPLFGIGMIVALHWVAFYGSIKYTNASVAVACIGTSSLFAALLEPLILRTKFKKADIVLGAGMLLAIYLVSEASPEGYAFGIGLGILSSLLAALFSILNKIYAKSFPAMLFTFSEMAGGWVFLCLLLPFYIHFMPGAFVWPDSTNWTYLGLLALFCTIVPFSLNIIALRHVSAFTSVFLVNLEPLYTFALAALIFKEHQDLSTPFYLGAFLMMACVIIHAILVRKGKMN
jgi:drug/metabolite transporter (DMT)-like permease